MKEIMKLFWWFLWKRDSETAACLMIALEAWLTKQDTEQMANY